MGQEECAEQCWKRHWQLLPHKDKEGIFSKLFSLCVIFLSQTARAFSYSSAPSTNLVSPVTLCHMAYPGHVLLCPLHLFFAFPELSLAFTEAISLKHQEAC